MRRDKHDKLFSFYIRTRDKWRCVRCRRYHKPPTSALHCSHYITRGAWNTRFDKENADALCYGCHQYWGGKGREEYKEFKIKQLGKKGFRDLLRRGDIPGNKRKLKEKCLHDYNS